MKTRPRFLCPCPASVGIAAALILSSELRAQITVTTAADENDTPAGEQVSLREAIRESANGGQITFDAALDGKALMLTAGEMTVAGKAVTVKSPGGLVIEARGLSRIFRVETGAGLNLTGLTLQGGRAPADGGAVLNAGTLSLTDCILRDNRSANGAPGIKGWPGVAPAYPGDSNSVIPGYGGWGGTGAGGGAVSSTGTLTVLRCRFTGNAAGNGGTGGDGGDVPNTGGQYWAGGGGGDGGTGGAGGAIYSSGSLALTECIFESNTAGGGGSGGNDGVPVNMFISGMGSGGTSGYGGAVRQTGSIIVERCSFVENACPPGGLPGPRGNRGGYSGNGAALFWNSGIATLTNCTIAGNRTGEGGTNQGSERGGAVASESGTLLRLVHCTMTRNVAARVRSGNEYTTWVTSTAAGIVSAVPVHCDNCILSGNLADRSTDNGVPVWEEANFSPQTLLTANPATPLGGAAGEGAQLGPLALSGGPLPVLIPGTASPALNAGVILADPPVVDQRGLPRTEGAPDLGAVEVQPLESTPLAPQFITFAPPALVQLTSIPLDVEVSAAASSNLPVSLELLSGPATLSGGTLTITGTGMVAMRATQAGHETTAPALPVVRVIEASRVLQTIAFTPAQNYPVYSTAGPTTVTLPATTSAGHTVTWSFVGVPNAGISLNGNVVTATGSGSLQIKGEHPGTELHAPVVSTWTLLFTPGVVWWEVPPFTPSTPVPGHYPLVEGSPHGFRLTAHIASPYQNPVPVPATLAMAGMSSSPAFIPAGQTSVECLITGDANPQLVDQARYIGTGSSNQGYITVHLLNRRLIFMDVTAPAHVRGGEGNAGTVNVPGIPTPFVAIPLDFTFRTLTVTASDYDHPEISVPVTGTVSPGGLLGLPGLLQFSFSPMNRRVQLTVTSDDGISGKSGLIEVHADTDTDGDGVNDFVEAALQRAPDQFDPPPLTVESDAASLHAVLGSRPLNLKGWTVAIETSTDLQTWTPAPAASTTVTPNPDGTTERVSVLLPAGTLKHYARLKAVMP